MSRSVRVVSFVSALVRVVRGSGFNLSRALVFEALYDSRDGWQISALANYVRQDRSAVRRWVRELQRDGYAVRRGDYITITEPGRAEFERRAEALFSACPPSLQDALKRAVVTLDRG